MLALGVTFLRELLNNSTEHHQAGLGVLMPKLPAGGRNANPGRRWRQGRLFAGVARQQMHQKMRLAVAVSKLLTDARVEFAFTLKSKSRFCHCELLWF
jgi:hypothetical protein